MNEPVPPPGPSPKLEPPLSGELYCLGCGARNDAGAVECWLCSGRSLVKAGPDGRPPEPSRPPRMLTFNIAALMGVVAIFTVGLGLYAKAPGLLILLAFTVFPAISLVEVKAARRRRRGMPMSGAERFGFFLLYLILVPVLLVGAGLVALFIFCSVTGAPDFH